MKLKEALKANIINWKRSEILKEADETRIKIQVNN